jgi:hypothetical protein
MLYLISISAIAHTCTLLFQGKKSAVYLTLDNIFEKKRLCYWSEPT